MKYVVRSWDRSFLKNSSLLPGEVVLSEEEILVTQFLSLSHQVQYLLVKSLVGTPTLGDHRVNEDTET